MTSNDDTWEFPVDDATLDLLWAAIYPRETDPDAKSSSLWSTLEMLSMMAPDAEIVDREYVREDGTTATRQEPALWYTDHSAIAALITEVRRLRSGVNRLAAHAAAQDRTVSWFADALVDLSKGGKP